MGVNWYGGVQIILGIMIAVPSITIRTDVPSMTIGLYIALVLTGLYAIIGTSYINSAKSSLSSLDAQTRQAYDNRLFTIYRQFLIVYTATTIILSGLSVGSFIEGTVLYFDINPTISDSGSTPAIAGVAAFLINIFISGSVIGEVRKLRPVDFSRPRSPTPNSQADISILCRPDFYPPPYTQSDTTVKWEEMPPSYLEAIQTIANNTTHMRPHSSSDLSAAVPVERRNVASETPQDSSPVLSSLPNYDEEIRPCNGDNNISTIFAIDN